MDYNVATGYVDGCQGGRSIRTCPSCPLLFQQSHKTLDPPLEVIWTGQAKDKNGIHDIGDGAALPQPATGRRQEGRAHLPDGDLGGARVEMREGGCRCQEPGRSSRV